MEGKVKWFDAEKGYGFITAEGRDFFVHHSKVPEGVRLNEGDTVTFDPVKDERGRDQAVNVQLGSSESAQAEESAPADESQE